MEHGLDTPYTCGICGIVLKGHANFNFHKMVHDKKYICLHCKQQFLRLDDWLKHRLVTYNKHEQQKCDECGRVFSRNDEADKHSKIHFICSDQTIECEICEKHFSTYELFMHMQLKHRKWPKLLQCILCDHRAKTAEMLSLHCSLIHDRKVCRKCGALFKNQDKLREHALRMTVQYYRCDQCFVMFSTEAWTKAHIRESHTSRRAGFERVTCTTCNVCKEVHGNIYSLNSHIRVKHLVRRDDAQKEQVVEAPVPLAEKDCKFVYVNRKRFGRTYECKNKTNTESSKVKDYIEPKNEQSENKAEVLFCTDSRKYITYNGSKMRRPNVEVEGTDPTDSFEDEDSTNEDEDLDYPSDNFEAETADSNTTGTNQTVIDAAASMRTENLLDTNPVDEDRSLSIIDDVIGSSTDPANNLNKQVNEHESMVASIITIQDHSYCKVLIGHSEITTAEEQ